MSSEGHKKRVKADSIKCQLWRLATGSHTSLVRSQQTLPYAVNLSCFPFLLPSRYVCKCSRAQEGKQRLIHQNMICRVFCLVVELFLLNTITGVKGLLKESAQPPCRKSMSFRPTSLLYRYMPSA